MAKYYIAAFAAVFLTAVAQLVLKKGAMTGLMKKGFIKSYFNFYSMLAHFIFFVVTVLKLFALKKVMLKEMVVILPLTYIIVPVISMIIFKEELNKKQLFGILIIVVGAVIFNLDHFIS